MQSLTEYLDALASAAPTPGGGSAAAVAAALGAALVSMVARVTAKSRAHEAVRAQAEALAARGDDLRRGLLVAKDADEAAYAAVIAAQALPRDDETAKARRTHAVQEALAKAARTPLAAATLALAVIDASRDALALGNRHIASDAGCAGELAAAALAACAYNVRVNHGLMRDPELVAAQAAELAAVESAAAVALAQVRDALDPRERTVPAAP